MNLFDIILSHPILAFFMAWPVGLTIISLAWQVSLTIENGMNFTLALADKVVVLFRGYTPTVIHSDKGSDEGSDE